jgi:transcriptional regulator with XRE-family HTH domain
LNSPADRLKEVIKVLSVSQAEIGRKIGVSPAQITQWIKGQNAIPMPTALAFQASLGISAEWLIHGKGEMLLPETKNLTPQERDLINAFKTLPHDQREKLIGYVEAKADEYRYLKEGKKPWEE